MTDRVRLIRFLEAADIGFKCDDGSTITLTAKEDKNVGGYTDFFAAFSFDRYGKSTGVAVWE